MRSIDCCDRTCQQHDQIQPEVRPHYPSMKWPKDARGPMRSQMILVTASIGIARMAPATPHIQYQNTTDRMTSTGLIVKRLASSIGVMVSPSMIWMSKYPPAG